MICPHCTDSKLHAVVRDGIEIDVCSRCHGMWLDHGELTRLRTADPVSTAAAPIPADQYDPDAFGDHDDGVGIRADTGGDDDDPQVRTRRTRGDKKSGKSGKKDKGKGRKSGKKSKPPTWSRRLGKIIEEVIDELD